MRRSRHIVAAFIATYAALAGATALLGSVHGQLQASRMSRHLERAEALVAAHDLEAGIVQYHAVLELERDNAAARRGLALTLLSLERWAEAESYVRDLLQEDPTDGVLNRALARIQAARGEEEEARRAYQRAIYGQWPATAADERITARFELIEYLRRVARPEEVVAELLTLKAELPPGKIAAARRVAGLLAELGETSAAIDSLTATAAMAPRDADLLAQLAALQVEAGQVREARATLRRAVALEPQRADVADRLAVVDRVLELDPTLPRLRVATRANRARALLAQVLEHTRACQERSAETPQDRADAERRINRRALVTAEAADQELALAARLWDAAPGCHGVSPDARAIAQVVQRIETSTEPS
jgi:tetratricopeptide (TPR) repeat protein